MRSGHEESSEPIQVPEDIQNSARTPSTASTLRTTRTPGTRFMRVKKMFEVSLNVDPAEEKGSMKATAMVKAPKAADNFEQLPVGKSNLAVDKNLVQIDDACERKWGWHYGGNTVKTTTEKIENVARFVKPHQKMDTRHRSGYQQWMDEEKNKQFSGASGPDTRSGIYNRGINGEMCHCNTQARLTKNQDGTGRYNRTLIRNLQAWCGNITKTIDAYFVGVDRTLRDEYRHKFAILKTAGDRLAAQTCKDEVFAYQTLFIHL
ncbi:hypothetical protein FN846DRAFT_885715 [Sphaerosporella brunnea]|uniref:Uncharacterized protein n=1 Tax=Sphaerosporella brunnea TaxID=1250544 RepID=A0A5J5FBS9_9PEZI|nr:hypothetical protein FN846DRAFT_885715 [Sphaerosporella brunnea]